MAKRMHRPAGLDYDIQTFSTKDGINLAQVAEEMPFTQMVRVYDHEGSKVDGFMGVKVADRITAVRTPKFELVSHAEMFNAVHKELDDYQEDYNVLRVWGNDNHKLAEIAIDHPFNMVEIEKLGNGADYFAEDRLNDDPNTYYPGLIIESNYAGRANAISFNIYRGICTNGMMWGEMLQKYVIVRHLNKSVQGFFQADLDQFMSTIFSDRLVDKVFKQYEIDVKTEAFKDFLEDELGKRRIADKIENDPKFARLMANKIVSAYAAYQLLTFMVSNGDLAFGRRLQQQNIANRFNSQFLQKAA